MQHYLVTMKESNRNALRNSLIIIDAKLDRMISACQGAARTPLPTGSRDHDHEHERRIAEIAGDMLGEVSAIREKYGLEKDERIARSDIRAALLDISILLDDLAPKRLSAYGELDRADMEYLANMVERLKGMLNAIWSLL